jgi:dihydropyrimidine dehydrogenase (NAD+) subunit PreT
VSLCPEPDVRAATLSATPVPSQLPEAVPAMTTAQAVLEAERCLYCFDAPCQTVCPTNIPVPQFIRRIGDTARAILEANPLGGLCARVCPTEELCEQVCVRNTQQGQPIAIGRLQRHAVDAAMGLPASTFFQRAPASGRTVAVVGAGPAGLACAHGLARRGHSVVIFEAHAKPGGLNEYGLASYKTAGGYAQREIAWLLQIGGLSVRTGWRLETAAQLHELRHNFDAVFLGIGLGTTAALGVPGDDLPGVEDAVDFIARLRQAEDVRCLPVGRRVVVIGGGMTAIDAAVQARMLGAEQVTIAYRRGPADMPASDEEQRWAQTHGVLIRHALAPLQLLADAQGRVGAVLLARQVFKEGRWQASEATERIRADQVLKAIGQRLHAPWAEEAGLTLQGGRLAVDAQGGTRLPGVFAGGDATAGGRDLTVEAVAHGQRAAQAIHSHLSALPLSATPEAVAA